MRPGAARAALTAALSRVLADDLDHRVLDFDANAAAAAAELAARRQRRGRPIDVRDTLIAGIALARSVTIATRNVRHFSDLEVAVVDPWGESVRHSRKP